MKKLLFIASVLAAGLTACTDNDIVEGSGKMPTQAGDEIRFGASQSPMELNDLDNSNDSGTRTHYGFLYDDASDLTKYPIYWDNGDLIAIYSPEAVVSNPGETQSTHETDYQITLSTTDDTNAGTLTKYETNGLTWTDKEEYNFYAFYPSSAKLNTVRELEDDGKTAKRVGIKLNLPTSQVPKEIVRDDNLILPKLTDNGQSRPAKGYVARPNMDYMYMYAHTTYNKETHKYATHTEKSGESESSVYLDFKPIVTTAEFIIHGPGQGADPIEVSQVVIRSAQAICGDFNLYIDNLGGENDGHTEATPDGTVTNQVTIPLYHEEDGVQKGVTLEGDEVLIVRAFLLPYETVYPQDVETAVTVHMVGGGTRTKLLKSSTGIQKHKINIADLPRLQVSGSNYWQSMINENAYFSQLSIPGAHNAYDINIDWKTGYTGSSNDNIMNTYQNLSIDDQLKAGARAFSFVVGFGDDNSSNGANDKLDYAMRDWSGSYPLYTYPGGKQGTSLETVLEDYVKALVDLNKSYYTNYSESPLKAREYLVLNIGFQQRNGSGDNNTVRNYEISRWLKEIDRILDETAEKMETQYTEKDKNNERYFEGFTNDIDQNTTNGDLGRKIVVFVTVQTPSWPKAGDSYTFTTTDRNQTVDYRNTTFTYDPNNDPEYYVAMCPAEDDKGYDITTTHAANNDRDYDYVYVMSPYGDDIDTVSGIKVWRQQLERLSYAGTTTNTNLTQYSKRTATKKTLVKDLFDEAINNNKDGNAIGNWYINNLGGFTVVTAVNSYLDIHGWGGNTVMAANAINSYAYEYLANTANNVAPCGIVLINFYGVDKLTGTTGSVDIYGITLPQVIIENNYRFALKAKETPTSGSNSGTTTQSDSKYRSGGNAIDWSY